MDAKYKRTNDKKKIKIKSVLVRFWQGFWRCLGRFGGYKNKIEKDLQKRRDKTPGIDSCSWPESWGQPT